MIIATVDRTITFGAILAIRNTSKANQNSMFPKYLEM